MEHVKHLVDIATILAPFLSFAIGALTVVVLRAQLRLARDLSARTETLTKELKRADIVQALNTRYDRLWQLRHNPSAVENAESFFLRFWSLQLDQFSHWRAELIPDEDYATWLKQRRGDYERNWAFKHMRFIEGWELASNDMVSDSGFLVLIDKVMVQGTTDLSAAMKQVKGAA